MSDRILVTGATGTVGSAVITELRDQGGDVVAFVRDRARAATLLGDDLATRVGDLGDEQSVRAALEGVDRVLLCSRHGPTMRDQQLTAVRAIATSNVERVVKISGSPVTVRAGAPAHTGRDHFAVETALRATGRQTVAVRPNVFMQGFLDQATAISHGALPGPEGNPRVSFVDARDVGAVAAAALLADSRPAPVLEVTGPEALRWFEVADSMTSVLGRPVTHYPASPAVMREGLRALGRPEWLVEHVVEIASLLSDPEAAEVTETVEEMTGRAPTTLRAVLVERGAAFPAAA